MPLWIVIATTSAYVLALFVIAWRGDRLADLEPTCEARPKGGFYALGLTVYCTSWTFYGAVGTAASRGWEFLWIYVGPAIVFLIFPHIVRRIGDVSKREDVTSISDFLSTRYGKSGGVAVIVTLAAVMGSLPYIALQLKSVGQSLAVFSGGTSVAGPSNESVLLTALAMTAFAILFGARQSDMTRANNGLIRVLGVEALVKLGALISVCGLSLFVLGGLGPVSELAGDRFPVSDVSARAITITILSMAAILCLPRQFHMAIIERRDSREVNWARWVFPLYLALTSAVVIPITLAGLSVLPVETSADIFVLALPLQQGANWLALLVFIGGFSAATGMVIVSSIALSTMVTNDIVVPTLLKGKRFARTGPGGGAQLIYIRRLVIAAIILLAYGYYRLSGNSTALAQIGLLSFAAAVQVAPALLGAIYWRRAKASGVMAGLMVGIALWAYTLFIPALVGAETMAEALPALLDPHALLGLTITDPLSHGVIWSLGSNALIFVIISLLGKERLRDRVQAVAFTASDAPRLARGTTDSDAVASISPDGLRALASRFLSREAVDEAFDGMAAATGLRTSGSDPAEWALVQGTERLLSRAIGASSARVIMGSVLGGTEVELDDLLTIFDQKSLSERFDQHMLQATLENSGQGISVVDGQQRLVAWNGLYRDMFDYPDSLLRVGTPIEELIAHNIAGGWIRGDDPVVEARRRVGHMRRGAPHVYERRNPDGRFLRIAGNPVPGGGYVTTFTDITQDKQREAALMEANETLEARVQARTERLLEMADDLDAARKEAEGANTSKTRFLAAASHDLMQPLNAARLFLGAVEGDRALVAKADSAIQSANDLLRGLLDITRLDQSTVSAKPVDVPLGPLLEDLVEEARPMAERAGLDIRLVPTSLSVTADPDFLQSILRNFISNARRYTREGGVLVGARRVGRSIRVEVWDTGPGIVEEEQARIFEEFQRGSDVDNLGVRGAGLGLSMARRLADIMGVELGLRSAIGKGSVFSLTMPRSDMSVRRDPVPGPAQAGPKGSLTGLRVLCVDDEAGILDGMAALLERWGCEVHLASDEARALPEVAHSQIDALIADYQLAPSQNGLDLIQTVRSTLSDPANVCLLTARRTKAVALRADRDGVHLLLKPADPSDIKTFLLDCVARLNAPGLQDETASR